MRLAGSVLTALSIQKMSVPAGARQVTAGDAKVPGLQVRRHASGEITFRFRYVVPGSGVRRELGLGTAVELAAAYQPDEAEKTERTREGKALAEARRRAAELRAMVRRGDDPAQERERREAAERQERERREAAEREERERVEREAAAAAQEAEEKSVAELAEAFARDHVPSLAPKSQAEARRQLDQVVKPAWGGRQVREITRRDAVELLARVHAERGPVAANRAQALLSRLWRYGLDTGRAEVSPVYALRRTKARSEKPRARVLRGDELRQVWEACGKISTVTGLALRFVLSTGARPGEVCAARWSDFEPVRWSDGSAGMLWRMPGEQRKSRKPHDLPLNELAVEILEALRIWTGERVHVFSLRGPDRPLVGLSHQARQVAKLAGVAGWVPHDLRRTAATLAADAGVPESTVELLLGHAREPLIETYQRSARLPELRAAAAAVESEIRAALAGTSAPAATVARIAG